MKDQFKLMSLFLVLFYTLGLRAENLPPHWYQLPEDGAPITQENLNFNTSENAADGTTGIAGLLKANAEALEAAKFQFPESDSKSDKPKDWVPWRFVSYIMDVGLSAKGLLGTLALKGSPALTVYWTRKENLQAPAQTNVSTAQQTSALNLDLWDNMNEEALVGVVEPMVAAIMSTGRVNNEQALQQNLLESVRQISAWGMASQSSAISDWYLSRLRFDLSISASGKVAFIASVGAGVRIRVEWHRTGKRNSQLFANDTQTLSPNTKLSYQNLLRDLAEDLVVISNEQNSIPSFRAKEFRVGLGLSASGDIGVIKSKVGTFFHIYFKRKKKSVGFSSLAWAKSPHLSRPILLIDREPKPQHVQFARARGVPVRVLSSEAIYKVDRKAHRKGLKKAIKMGRYFAKAAESAEASNWFISKLKIGLGLSLTGDIGMTQISAATSSEIAFAKIQQQVGGE